MHRTLVLGLCLLLMAVHAAADEGAEGKPAKPLSVEQAADRVRAAWKADDKAALEHLAAQDRPDPWLVVDLLLERGAADAAGALAKAGSRKATAKLADYVTARRGEDEDDARTRLAAVRAAIGKADWAGALEAAGDEPSELMSVPWIRIVFGRGLALTNMKKRREASVAYRAAADAAQTLGWVRFAEKAYHQGAIQAYELSDWSTAEVLWEGRLAMAELLDQKRTIADTVANLALLRQNQGDYATALTMHERALALRTSLRDALGIAFSHNNMGILYDLRAEFPKALAAYGRTLAAGEALNDARLITYSLNNIGIVHQKLGEYAEALAAFERARPLAIARKDPMLVAQIHNNEGIVRRRLGQYEQALASYRKALQMAELLRRPALQARALQNIGVLHLRLEEYDPALEALERALVMREAMRDQAGMAQTLGNIGIVHESRNEFEKAFGFYERSLEIATRIGDGPARARALANMAHTHQLARRHAESLALGKQTLEQLDKTPDPATRAGTLQVMSLCHLNEGRPAQAAVLAREGLAVVESLTRGLAEQEGASARDLWTNLFDCGAQAARLLNDPGELSYFLERGRAGSLLESIQARGELWTVLVPAPLRAAERKAVAHETKALETLQRATQRGRLRPARAARKALAAARAEVEVVVARMEREAKAASSIVHARVDDLDVIQARLADGQALVLYAATTDTVMALIVRKRDARIVSLGTTAMVREARLALALSDAQIDPTAALERLGALLVAPLGLGRDDRTVLVSPAGELGYLPFALLLPDRDVAYVPSGTVHGLLRDSAADGGGTKVLALGDPIYAPARGLTALPATREEVAAVGDTRLLGEQATQKALEQALAGEKRWRAVHFACHGLVDPESPLRSALALTATPEDDGTLSCRDVFRLTIAADLVVLSACETAKGRIFKTEGIVGLTRAFLFAGAPRVICSLWKVDDEATRALMIKFYELWNPKAGKGLAAAAALRQAQAFVRSHPKWKHPYYWGAWVLWGLPE